MEIAHGIGVYGFSSATRLYGTALTIRGRIYIFGATQRGFFWRFGARVFSPYPGHFESVFGLRTRIGEIDLLLKLGLRDEVVPVLFKCPWVHGSLHFSRSGSISFIIHAVDTEMVPKMASKTPEDFAKLPMEDADFYLSSAKESDQMVSREDW